MKRIIHLNLFVVLLVLAASGCATYPTTLTSDATARIKAVAVLDEINTPTSISQSTGNAGPLLVAIAATMVKDQLTTAVEQNLDFRRFTRDTLRELIIAAVKRHPGWIYVELKDLAKADAAFVLDVTSMGIGEPRFFQRFPPTITFSATLIAKPPFEIVRSGRNIQSLDPVKSPNLYQRTENVRDGFFFNCKELPDYKFYEYTSDPDAFKTAFRAAIDLGVKRIEASWQDGQTSK